MFFLLDLLANYCKRFELSSYHIDWLKSPCQIKDSDKFIYAYIEKWSILHSAGRYQYHCARDTNTSVDVGVGDYIMQAELK